MRQAVDHIQLRPSRRRGGGECPALGVRDDRIIAAVDDNQRRGEPVEPAPLGIERGHLPLHGPRQGADQSRHALGVPVGDQRVHRLPFRTEPGGEHADIGAGRPQLARRHLDEQVAVGGVAQVRRVAPQRHPLAVGVGLAMPPRSVGPVAEIPGGQIGEHGNAVVVTADGKHEADAITDVVLERRDQRRTGGVGDADEPDRARASTAGEVAHRVGNVPHVARAHLERAQVRDVGHQDEEPGPGKHGGEHHQTRIVRSRAGRPRYQHQRRDGAVAGPVDVTPVAAPRHLIAHRHAVRRRRRPLEPAGPGPGDEIAQHRGGFDDAGRRTRRYRQRPQHGADRHEPRRPACPLAHVGTHLPSPWSRRTRRAAQRLTRFIWRSG